MVIVSAVSKYLSRGSRAWFYGAAGYLIVLTLISGIIVIITFKLSKKQTVMKSEILKAEKMLLYHTMFVIFWMALAKIVNIVLFYLIGTNQDNEASELGLAILMDACYLISNSGSLLFLFYVSSTVREEFYEMFKLFHRFKPQKVVSNSVPFTF